MTADLIDLEVVLSTQPIATPYTKRVQGIIEIGLSQNLVCGVIGPTFSGVTTAVHMALAAQTGVNFVMLTMSDIRDGRALQEMLMRKLGVPALPNANIARQAEYAADQFQFMKVRLIVIDRGDLLAEDGVPSRDAVAFLKAARIRARFGIIICGRPGVEVFIQSLANAVGPPPMMAQIDHLPADGLSDLTLYATLLKLMARKVKTALGEISPKAEWLLTDDAARRFMMASRASIGMTAYLLRLGVDDALRNRTQALTRETFDVPWRNCCLPYRTWGASFTFGPFSREDAPSLTEIGNALKKGNPTTEFDLPRRPTGKGSRMWSRK